MKAREHYHCDMLDSHQIVSMRLNLETHTHRYFYRYLLTAHTDTDVCTHIYITMYIYTHVCIHCLITIFIKQTESSTFETSEGVISLLTSLWLHLVCFNTEDDTAKTKNLHCSKWHPFALLDLCNLQGTFPAIQAWLGSPAVLTWQFPASKGKQVKTQHKY